MIPRPSSRRANRATFSTDDGRAGGVADGVAAFAGELFKLRQRVVDGFGLGVERHVGARERRAVRRRKRSREAARRGAVLEIEQAAPRPPRASPRRTRLRRR